MRRTTTLFMNLFILLVLSACTAPMVEPETSFLAANPIDPHRPTRGPANIDLFLAPTAGGLVAYDMSQGREQFSLPAGLLSADGNHYYAASVERNNTRLAAFDPDSGEERGSLMLDGRWSLSSVAPAGRWLAITRDVSDLEKGVRLRSGEWQTAIQVVDMAAGQVEHALELDGNFEVETISAAGDALFLIEHLPAVDPTSYLVRLYDLRAEELLPEPLRDKRLTDQVMTGQAWNGVASIDGRWLLTLYLNTEHNTAFIHTLDLVQRAALCIELPSGAASFDALKDYSLVLTPDGRRAYAANAALGVVAEVSLVDEMQVVGQVAFPASATGRDASAEYGSRRPGPQSSLAPDGRRLYFSHDDAIWAYDVTAAEVSGPYEIGDPVTGLGLSADGQRLYVAVAGGRPLVLDNALIGQR